MIGSLHIATSAHSSLRSLKIIAHPTTQQNSPNNKTKLTQQQNNATKKRIIAHPTTQQNSPNNKTMQQKNE